MPIQIPNLDDRNYDQLIKETDVLIARYFPEYADIGPTDPAVAINELFCYLFDFTMYQLNRITPDTRTNFASLSGIEQVYGQPPEEALRQALAKQSRVDRAITSGDIETVLKKVSQDKALYSEPVLRVYSCPGKSSTGLVRVFIVQDGAMEELSEKHKEDLRNLYIHLRGRSPVGTRYLLAHAPLLKLNVSAEIVKRKDSTITTDRLADDICDKLTAYINPLEGGPSGQGWVFGKAVSRGDIYHIIEGMPGVDHVKTLNIKASGETLYSSADMLSPPEGGLLEFEPEESDILVT